MTSKDVEQLTAAFALEIAGLRETLAGSISQWANAKPVKGARALPISRALILPNMWDGDGRLMGWSLRVDPTATGPATITLRDGDADGDLLATVSIAPGAASNHFLPGGVNVGRSLVAVVTQTTPGTLTGAVYYLD